MNPISQKLEYSSDRYDVFERFNAMVARGAELIETGANYLLDEAPEQWAKRECGFVSIATGLDLLFRARLVTINWALEFENIDMPKQEEQLGFEKVVNGLSSLGVLLEEEYREDKEQRLHLALSNFSNYRNRLLSAPGPANVEIMISVASQLLDTLTREDMWKFLYETPLKEHGNLTGSELDEHITAPQTLVTRAHKLSARAIAIWSSVNKNVVEASKLGSIFRCPDCHQCAAYLEYNREHDNERWHCYGGCDETEHDIIERCFTCQFCKTSTYMADYNEKLINRIVMENLANPPIRADEVADFCTEMGVTDSENVLHHVSQFEDMFSCYRNVRQHQIGCAKAVLEFCDRTGPALYLCCCCGKQNKVVGNWKCYSTGNADAFEREIKKVAFLAR